MIVRYLGIEVDDAVEMAEQTDCKERTNATGQSSFGLQSFTT
jgi:hypothetical protein